MSINNDLINKIQDLGFTVTPHERDGKNGAFKNVESSEIPSIEQLLKLFQLLSYKHLIFFWDAYKPLITEPGAYYSAVVVKADTVIYLEANYGWTSPWKKMSCLELAEIMQKNWDNEYMGSFLNSFRLSDNYHIDSSPFKNLEI